MTELFGVEEVVVFKGNYEPRSPDEAWQDCAVRFLADLGVSLEGIHVWRRATGGGHYALHPDVRPYTPRDMGLIQRPLREVGETEDDARKNLYLALLNESSLSVFQLGLSAKIVKIEEGKDSHPDHVPMATRPRKGPGVLQRFLRQLKA